MCDKIEISGQETDRKKAKMLSKKLQDLVDLAENVGLKVEVTKRDESKVMDTISIYITSGYEFEPRTLMEQLILSEAIHIHAFRFTGDGKPRAYKISGYRGNALRNPMTKDIKKNSEIEFYIRVLGEDVDKWLKNRLQPTAA